MSSVSRRLFAIWLRSTIYIVRTIRRPELPAYDDAVTLAMTKAPLSLEGSHLTPRLWLPRLLRNANLASSTCAEFKAYFSDARNTPTNPLALRFTPLAPSYYVNSPPRARVPQNTSCSISSAVNVSHLLHVQSLPNECVIVGTQVATSRIVELSWR